MQMPWASLGPGSSIVCLILFACGTLYVRDYALSFPASESAEKQQVDAHADAHDGEEGGEGDGLDGDLAGDPGAGAELARNADVVENSGDVDDDAEGDEGNAGIDGEAGVAGGDLLGAVKFAQEKAEAREGEADAHEAEAGANPRKEGAFRGEVNARVVDFSGHRGIVLGAGC